ncbi:hypothetical protein BR93DRAFT_972387 [Coniochaeta sp. PMI_546]|nr:hypothetical protein BR93DRAFT_972387 [Coniochaeta sp. PMI_546]
MAAPSARPIRPLVMTPSEPTNSTTDTVAERQQTESESTNTRGRDKRVESKSVSSSAVLRYRRFLARLSQLLYTYKGVTTTQKPAVKVDYFNVPYQWLVTATFSNMRAATVGQSGEFWTVCACIYLEDLRQQLHLGIDLKSENHASSPVSEFVGPEGSQYFTRHAHAHGSRFSPEQTSWFCRAYLASRNHAWTQDADVLGLISCDSLESIEVYKTMSDSPFLLPSSDPASWSEHVSIPAEAEIVYQMSLDDFGCSETTKTGYKRVAETMQNRPMLEKLFGARSSED